MKFVVIVVFVFYNVNELNGWRNRINKLFFIIIFFKKWVFLLISFDYIFVVNLIKLNL